MIRITSGVYRGRRVFTGNALKARPATSLIREAIFNVLRSYADIEGLRVCDIFCGSGSLTFEAISRGAVFSCLVDIDTTHLKLVQKTAASLGIENMLQLVCCDMNRLVSSDHRYDIAFVDPPFKEPKLIGVSLSALLGRGWCGSGSIVVLRVREGEHFVLPHEYKVICRRMYCGSEVIFLAVSA
ncbi:MAG: RsmD family RNA methyltransferase [Aaplasma endosymbiont of Hyalomma asiaticum]